ncbi:hypothetical protein LG634_04360 [Streptomyces bambusae]|uniref:hypothetical protein n=1 Tax=Streptomyces bambusae TaxID=1550616 RepID=UPI001CFC5D90|nr:hypothetical protein [Streptomyces bambusae]MCB5164069.1 hypothetical protein [Streptomyces bambusae]
MATGWELRTARVAVFTAVCVLLTTLGHVMMSGHTVPWWVPAAGAAALGGPAWLLAARERRRTEVLVFAMAAQGLLHTAFSLVPQPAGTGAAPAPTAGASGAGHLSMHHPPAPHPPAGTPPGGPEAMDHLAAGGTRMLALHLLAALLCAWWLACGESAAFRILRAVGTRLAAPFRRPPHPPAPLVPHRPRVRHGRPAPARPLRRLLLSSALTFRGPPVGHAAG